MKAEALPRGANLRQATAEFLGKLSAPRILESRTSTSPATSGQWTREDQPAAVVEVQIPPPSEKLVIQRRIQDLHTCTLAGSRFPPLDLPKVIQEKTIPPNLADFKAWIASRFPASPPGQKSEWIIPYYDPSDPIIFLLNRVNGVAKLVIGASPARNGEGWQMACHFDLTEGAAELRRLAPRIVTAQMATLLH